jgi:hypothetical protein
MGFVGNYALGGLSPQIYDMPVIPKKKGLSHDSHLLQYYIGNVMK